MKKKLFKTFIAVASIFIGGSINGQTAKVQIIHNCADAAASQVDVYVNGTLTFDNFAFRTSTSFLDLPAGVALSVAIAPSNSTNVSQAIYTTSLTLTASNRYVVVANGIVSPTGYSPAPAFALNAYNLGTSTGVAPAGQTGLFVVHGSTDAPAVDVGAVATGSYTNIIDNLAYSTTYPTATYANLPTADYSLQIRTADGATAVAEYSAPLQTLNLSTASIVVLASGFLTPANNSNGPAFGLYVATPSGGALVQLPSQGFTGSRLQIIHNAADAAAASVDVYLNNNPSPTLNNFAFRTATPFIDLPSSTNVEIDIAGGNSTGPNDAIFTQTVNVPTGTYIAVANGIVSPTGYSPTPAFGLDLFAGGREAATTNGNTDVLVYHGSTDAPTVDVKEVTGPTFPTLVDNAAYGDFAGYLELPTVNYTIQVRTEDGADAVAEYSAPLQTLGLNGAALVVLASGFLNPANNSNGAAFGLYVALPSGGNLIPLPSVPVSTSRLQVIHNAADPAAATVDIAINGTTVLDNFAFRSATPFIDVKAGVPYTIDVKTPDGVTTVSSTPNVTLTGGEKYVIIAQGVVGNGFETNSDVDADNKAFKLYVKSGAKEKADNNSTFALLGVHGSTDAPKVDIVAAGINYTVLDNVSYGDISSAYGPVPVGAYVLNVTPAADNATIVASYDVNLTTLGGKAGVVFASGFLTPANDNNGPAFSLCYALADGTTGCFSNVTSVNENSLAVNSSLYPNPADNMVTFEYTLKDKADLSMRIVDLTGRVIESNYIGNQPAGLQRKNIDLSNYSSGIYFIQINSGNNTLSKKLIVTK